MRHKKQSAIAVIFVLFCVIILYYYPVYARHNIKISQEKVILNTGKSKK